MPKKRTPDKSSRLSFSLHGFIVLVLSVVLLIRVSERAGRVINLNVLRAMPCPCCDGGCGEEGPPPGEEEEGPPPPGEEEEGPPPPGEEEGPPPGEEEEEGEEGEEEEGSISIRGNIYSQKSIANLTVTGPAVVSARIGSPGVTDSPTVWKLSGYNQSLSDDWGRMMESNIVRLLSERAKTGFDGIKINPNNRLGGEVWKVPTGDLSLGGTLTGPLNNVRGTIIVEQGNVRVTSDLQSYQPVGIIARRGSITIAAGVNRIDNVYFYAPNSPNGRITFENGTNRLDASGSFIADQFTLGTRPLALTYSALVAIQPPPGFVSLIVPTVLEKAP